MSRCRSQVVRLRAPQSEFDAFRTMVFWERKKGGGEGGEWGGGRSIRLDCLIFRFHHLVLPEGKPCALHEQVGLVDKWLNYCPVGWKGEYVSLGMSASEILLHSAPRTPQGTG